MTLIIKESSYDDLPNILNLWNTPDVMFFVGYPNGLETTLEAMNEWFDRIQHNSNCKHYSIYQDTIYCGETFYRIEDGYATVDIKLMPEARGQSIASCALSKVLSILLGRLNIPYAKVDPNPNNLSAISLYKRLGFKRNTNTEQDWTVSLETFKPSTLYLETQLEIHEIPEIDYPRLWEISKRDAWYPFTDTNAPYFNEHRMLSYAEFVAEKKRPSLFGIYIEEYLIGEGSFYWECKETQWLEIGLVLYDHRFWHKGIGTVVLKSMAKHLFDTIPEIERVGFVTWSGNIGMMRSGDKAGFKKEAVLRKIRFYKGTYYDSVRYGLTREEFTRFNTCITLIECKNPVEKHDLTERILRLNPNHFGIESSLLDYAENSKTYIVYTDPSFSSVVSLKVLSKTTLEIDAIAIDPKKQGMGLGTLLIDRCVLFGRQHGYQSILVKTLADIHPDPHYARTRHFYETYGFVRTQLFLTLWGEHNPCQEYRYDL